MFGSVGRPPHSSAARRTQVRRVQHAAGALRTSLSGRGRGLADRVETPPWCGTARGFAGSVLCECENPEEHVE